MAAPDLLSTGLATPKERNFSTLGVSAHWVYLCHLPDPDLIMVAKGVAESHHRACLGHVPISRKQEQGHHPLPTVCEMRVLSLHSDFPFPTMPEQGVLLDAGFQGSEWTLKSDRFRFECHHHPLLIGDVYPQLL